MSTQAWGWVVNLVNQYHPKITIYKTIYTLLLKGRTQTQISKIIRRDKSQICRITQSLERAGFIICITPQCNSKLYAATKKPFNIKNVKELYKLPSDKVNRIHGRCEIVQIQKASFIADVKEDHSNGSEKYDKVWCSNGVSHYLFSYPFSNIGEIKFQRIVGRNSDQVKVILPRMIWHRDNGNPEVFLFETADRAVGFFTSRFHLVLGGLHVCQRPDFALVLDDSVLVDLAQKGTYHDDSGVVMIDSSAPDNIPEIESKRWDVISGLASAPDRIRSLEFKVSRIESAMSRVESSLVRIEGLFVQPVKLDERVDVV